MSDSLPLVEHLQPPTVLVISAQTERWVAIQDEVRRWPVHATLDVCMQPDDALRLISRAQPELLVVDGGLGDTEVAALIRQVTREHPQVEALTFASGDADPSYMVWPWTTLDAVLSQWIEQYLQRNSLELASDWLMQ
jgi:response regulator of citrate/malate metabolism